MPFKFHYLFLNIGSLYVDYSIYFKIFDENVLLKSGFFSPIKSQIIN